MSSQCLFLCYRVTTEKLVGEIQDFCDYDLEKINSSIQATGINFVTEDKYLNDCLLVGVKGLIRNNKTLQTGLLENSWLQRTCNDGTTQWLAGTKDETGNVNKSFSYIRSVLQLNHSHMLIGDKSMKCIRILDELSGVVSTFSGKCSTKLGGSLWSLNKAIDGGIASAEYDTVTQLYHSPNKPQVILVVDRNKIREMNLNSGVVSTIFTHKKSRRIEDVIWQNDTFLLCLFSTLEAYYSNWTFKEQVFEKKISTLYGKDYTGIDNLHISSLSEDLLLLSFVHKVFKNDSRLGYLRASYDQYRSSVLYSMSKRTSFIILYDPASADSALGTSPSSIRITASSLTLKLYFSSTRMNKQTYCSSLKMLPIKGG